MDRDDIFWRAVWSWFQKSYQVDHVATFTKSSPTMYEPFADPYHWRTVYVPTFTLIFSCIINTLLRGSSPYRNGAAPRWRSPWAASSYSKPCEPSCGDAWGGNFVWSCDLISASFRLVKYNSAIWFTVIPWYLLVILFAHLPQVFAGPYSAILVNPAFFLNELVVVADQFCYSKWRPFSEGNIIFVGELFCV